MPERLDQTDALTKACQGAQGRWRPSWMVGVLAAALLGAPGPARAADVRVAMLPFTGPAGEDVMAPLGEAMPSGFVLVPAAQVEAAVDRAGDRLTLPAGFAALGRQVRAGALIEGRTNSPGGEEALWRLVMTVRQANTGAAVGSVRFVGRNRRELSASVQRLGGKWLETMLGRTTAAAPPPEAAPEPRRSEVTQPRRSSKAALRDERPKEDEKTGEQDEEQPPGIARSADAPESAGPYLWELSVGPRMISRAFVFTDNVSGLPGYNLPGTMGILGEAQFFPGAHSKSAVRNFGFAGQWETSVGAKTLGRDGQRSYPTRAQSYRVGPRFRMQSGAFAATLGADYGEHTFQLEVPDTLPPNVVYTLLRPSLGVRLEVRSGLSLGISAAYLHVLSVGGLGDEGRFPRISSMGAEVGAMFGYAIDDDFELRLAADLRHYAHSMHVKPGDAFVVGGAVDDHFGASLLISYRLR